MLASTALIAPAFTLDFDLPTLLDLDQVEARPAWSDAIEPTLENFAEWLGYQLGADGELAELLTPDESERRAFERGHDAGDSWLWTVDPLFAADRLEVARALAGVGR